MTSACVSLLVESVSASSREVIAVPVGFAALARLRSSYAVEAEAVDRTPAISEPMRLLFFRFWLCGLLFCRDYVAVTHRQSPQSVGGISAIASDSTAQATSSTSAEL